MALPIESLTIVPASPEQTVVSRKYTYDSWGRGLTEEQYLARDDALQARGFASNGKLITWVLVPRDDTGTLDFCSSCESYRRQVVLSSPGKEEPSFTWGYAIASVFTRPHLRRNGYAGHMMRLLHHVLAQPTFLPSFPLSWGPPPHAYIADEERGILSVLYSDVGENFYAACGPCPDSRGWAGDSRTTTVWEDCKRLKLPLTERGVRSLDESDVYTILERNQDALIRDLALRGAKTRCFSFLPADHLAEFQISRCKLTPSTSNPDSTAIQTEKWGAAVSETQFAVWTYEALPAPSRLIVTHLRASDSGSFGLLVSAAVQAALEVGMELVELWGLPQGLEVLATQLGGRTYQRDEHLPSICWYGEKGEWENNEKFAWC